MKAEYKRVITGNYLILYADEEPDTASYQMRMLVGNTIPSILKCRVQGVDGRFRVCFDITSRQSVSSLFEEKKLGYQDLCMILGGFIQIMDELSEYLLNPERLVVKPEFMYVDLEKRQLYFCYLPGYAEDIRQKFQELTEYILPKLDHEDQKAVMLGYAVYRRALEDSFHLEHIKRELYQEREEKEIGWENLIEKKTDEKQILSDDIYEENRRTKKENGKEDEVLKRDENLEKLSCEDELIWYESEPKEDKKRGKKHIYSEMVGMLTWCICAALAILMVIAGSMTGYLPRLPVAGMIAGILAAMGIGMVWVWFAAFRKQKKEKENSEKSELAEEPIKNISVKFPEMEEKEEQPVVTQKNFGETVVLSAGVITGPATLVSREPGELATIYLQKDLTVVGKMENAADAVIDLPTVSRIHAKIRKRDGEYYLTDLNSRNGTSVNGKMLLSEEEYCLQDQDEVDFAQARYIFLK